MSAVFIACNVVGIISGLGIVYNALSEESSGWYLLGLAVVGANVALLVTNLGAAA